MAGFDQNTSARIVHRDRKCCAWCGNPVHGQRGIDWSIHHRRARSMGGSSLTWVNQAANGVVVHGNGTQGCHGDIESHKELAEQFGFRVYVNGVLLPADVPIKHAVHGWIRMDNEGGFTPVNKQGEEWGHVEG